MKFTKISRWIAIGSVILLAMTMSTNLAMADFGECDHPELFYPGANLFRADLTGYDIQYCDLSRADLRAVEFGTYRSFEGVNLDYADLSKANLPGHYAMTGAKELVLRGANAGGNFYGLYQNPDFQGSILKGVFVSSQMINADFRYATLEGGALYFSILDGADFRNVKMNYMDIVGSSLEGADFRDADLTNMLIGWSDFTNARFDGAQISGTEWYAVTCPDGTESDDHGFTCIGHLSPR